MEARVREVSMPGLAWGQAAKRVPIGYGLHKLQMLAIVTDDEASVDDLQERIEALDELVQSVDVAAFNKL